MLSAHRGAANFRNDAAVTSWLYRIVVNACLDRMRRNKAHIPAAVIAVDMQGYSVADAAELLGVPEGTVKSRCARARARLAVALHYLDKAGSVEPETIDY